MNIPSEQIANVRHVASNLKVIGGGGYPKFLDKPKEKANRIIY